LKPTRWHIAFVTALVALSSILYLVHYRVFHDLRDVTFYALMDLAFLPVQVLLVTLVIERLLNGRERQAMLGKLNMVIGAFYSEVGGGLLRQLAAFDTEAGRVREQLLPDRQWTERRFAAAIRELRAATWQLDSRSGNLSELRALLTGRRMFLLGLLENPNLLEHETFTELLWAVFHLSEELEARTSFSDLPETDLTHLNGDMLRAYRLLVVEWLAYMQHLSKAYPYLFSLALRVNPFDPKASAVVR
jgi:hypothetical protein